MENKATILLVDDDVSLLKLLAETLSAEGYEVISTINGSNVLALCNKHQPDVVITDIVMPESDGIEVLDVLHKCCDNIPVIAMSGGNKGFGESYLKMAEKLGANLILKKPFKMKDLVSAVSGILK